MSKKSVLIKSTRDYSLFKTNQNNRQLKQRKHRKLEESMKKNGFLPYWPIVVQKNGKPMPVLDGQHRLIFAEQLETEVYYVEADIDFSISEINDTQRPWAIGDYAEVYAQLGNQHYADGLEFCERTGISIGNSFALLAGVNVYSAVEVDFKSGTFEVKEREFAEKVASVYCPAISISRDVRNSAFLGACMAACRVKGFSPARMVQQMKKCRDKFAPYSTRDSNLDMMEKIYNFGKKTSTLFPLKIEAAKATREASEA